MWPLVELARVVGLALFYFFSLSIPSMGAGYTAQTEPFAFHEDLGFPIFEAFYVGGSVLCSLLSLDLLERYIPTFKC